MNDAFKPLIFVLVAAAAIGGGWFVLRPMSGEAKELIPWRTDYKAAMDEGMTQSKPILLDFSATWCGPCKEMAKTTWADPQVATALQAYVPVHVDIDANSGIARQYGIELVPTLIVMDRTGQVLKKSSGRMDSGQFLAWLNEPAR